MSAAIRAALLLSVAVGAAVAVVGACLPDPPPLPPPPDAAVIEPSAPATSAGCGDGVIATLDDGGDAGEACDPGTDSVLGCTPQCTISCGGVIGPSGHCYFLADPAPDYKTALTNCGGAQAHVVTVDSDDESALVRALVGDGGTYRIGLADDSVIALGYKTPNGAEPGWPQSDDHCPGCYARGTDDAGIFALAGDAGPSHPCLVAGADDRWLQVACSDPIGADAGYRVVCEREPVGQRATACGGPLCMSLPQTAGKKRYVVSLGAATAAEAQKFCADFDGGALVTIASNQEREQLARELRLLLPPERGSIQVWIGLTRFGADWKWDDGSEAGPPWAENEPSPEGYGRAYIRLDENVFDTQLAKTDIDGGAQQRIFVCQRAP